MNSRDRNVSVLKKTCYDKGISLYDSRTLKPKDRDRLAKECSNGSGVVQGNRNTAMYGVPPRPERARAIRNAQPNLTVQEAMNLAESPFYSFKNPMYMKGSPIAGNKNSLYYTIGHDVWTIVPEYFPGPSRTNAKPPVKKVPTAVQTLRKKQEDAKRDQAYKKKWNPKSREKPRYGRKTPSKK